MWRGNHFQYIFFMLHLNINTEIIMRLKYIIEMVFNMISSEYRINTTRSSFTQIHKSFSLHYEPGEKLFVVRFIDVIMIQTRKLLRGTSSFL